MLVVPEISREVVTPLDVTRSSRSGDDEQNTLPRVHEC
jgi:hypothetical protein